MKKLLHTFLLLIVCMGKLFAQDPQLSQFYASPLYLNPAFVGSAMSPRIIANYRNQWSAIGGSYNTAMFSADHYIDGINSGVGILLVNDSQGLGKLQTNSVSALYSYQLKITQNNYLRAGFQGGYTSKKLNTQSLTFGDQYTNAGFDKTITSADNDILKAPNKNLLDLSAGLMAYGSHYWFGGAVHHLNKPSQSFFPTGTDVLPMKISVQAGLNIPIFGFGDGLGDNVDRQASISPAVLFKQQGVFQQLDAGLYFTYTPITVGAWYRGIPLKKVAGIAKQDALIFLLGLRQENFSVGYSYDATISKLGPASGGSHEISFTYLFDAPDKSERRNLKRRKQELSCPKF
jgi:type IX secretion system PorP/SprF family membrane protein